MADFDAFDSVQIPDTAFSEAPGAPAETSVTPTETAPVDAAAAPEQAAIPAEQPPGEPGELPHAAPEWQADGSLKLPDGRVLSRDEIAENLGRAPGEIAPPPAPKFDPVMERLEALTKQIEEMRQPAKAPEPPAQDFINPVTEPAEWIKGWMRDQRSQGNEVSWQDGEAILARAQAYENNRLMQRLNERFDAQEREKAQLAEQTKIQAEIQAIEATGKYDSLKSAKGQELLSFFVKSLKPGENLEAAYKRASEFRSGLIHDEYVKPKQEKANSVVRSLPRNGGARPSPTTNYGGGFDAFEKMAQDMKKGA